MAYPSGTFSDPSPGRLEVHFSSEFSSSAAGGDWWGGGGSWNVILKCTINDNAGNVKTAVIQFGTPTATVTMDYPGGNAAWTLAIEHYNHSYGGLGGVSAINPTITAFLIKK